ncbi:MAG: TolC family protein [Planctomycetota bacterium]
MDLRYRLGCRIPLDFRLAGAREPLEISEADALEFARERSFALRKMDEEIDEQERVLGEFVWEYMPQFTFQMGLSDLRNDVTVNLTQSGFVWGVDLDAESYFGLPAGRETTFPTDLSQDRFFNFQVRVPLFDGFRRQERRSRDGKVLRILRLQYLDARSDLEHSVLKVYQDWYELQARLEIVQRRVEIAKKRLDINEKLKEFGRIDDNQLETFRNAFFAQQDALYAEQDNLIRAEEDIRRYLMDADTLIEVLERPGPYEAMIRGRFGPIPGEEKPHVE